MCQNTNHHRCLSLRQSSERRDFFFRPQDGSISCCFMLSTVLVNIETLSGLERKGFIWLFPGHSLLLRAVRGEIQVKPEAETVEEWCFLAPSLWPVFKQLSYTTLSYLPRGGTADPLHQLAIKKTLQSHGHRPLWKRECGDWEFFR